MAVPQPLLKPLAGSGFVGEHRTIGSADFAVSTRSLCLFIMKAEKRGVLTRHAESAEPFSLHINHLEGRHVEM